MTVERKILLLTIGVSIFQSVVARTQNDTDVAEEPSLSQKGKRRKQG